MSGSRTFFRLLVVAAFFGCGESAQISAVPESSDIGITYREGKGLEVSKETKQAIRLETAEVTEGILVSRFVKTGTVINRSEIVPNNPTRLTVSLTSEEAKSIQVGQKVSSPGFDDSGVITSVSEPLPLSMGEHEATVEFKSAPVNIDSRQVDLSFELTEHDASALIPKSALLPTAEGTFVYVPNGKYLFRTAVTVGKQSDEAVQIIDGLYSGDEVVSKPVMTLWLAELQAIKGGASCADGH